MHIFLFENNTMEIHPVVGCQDSMLALTNGTPKAEAVETLSLSRRIEPQGMPDVSGKISPIDLKEIFSFFVLMLHKF